MQVVGRELPQSWDRLAANLREAFGAEIRAALQETVQPGPLHDTLLNFAETGLIPEIRSAGVGWLPILACAACGGDPQQALPLAAAWQLVRLAVKLLDDVEDGVRAAVAAASQTVNAAAALYSAAHITLQSARSAGARSAHIRQITDGFHRALLAAAAGQHRELQARSAARVLSPDEWFEIAAAKSGALLQWAVMAGALAAGAHRTVVAALGDFGRCLGILLQLSDDLTDCWQPGPEESLASVRLSLPVSYAFWVAADDDARQLHRLLAAPPQDAAAADELGQLLNRMGAQAYLLTVAFSERTQALAALDKASSVSKQDVRLLQPMIDHVFPMFGALGV